MKKVFSILFVVLSLMVSFGAARATTVPYNIGHITQFLSDGNYFHGYSDVTSWDFTGLWRYTAIGSEAGNINITKESTGGVATFSTGNLSKWGSWDTVNFGTDNLYFQDATDRVPVNVMLDPYNSGSSGNNGFFELYRLTNSSSVLGYLSNRITLDAGTFIVGFNDNGVPASGDTDFDDIIVAMQRVNPVPEPATMFLLGTGLIGLAGFGRKRLLKK